MTRTRSLVDELSRWPDTPPDLEELIKEFDMTPERLQEEVDKYIPVMEAVERLKNLIPRWLELVIPPEGALELDNCTWWDLQWSDLSQVEIDLIQGEIEIEVNGTIIPAGTIAFPYLASGHVRIHGTQNNTIVTVTNL